MNNNETPNNEHLAGALDRPTRKWTQQGFCVVSKVIIEGESGYLPLLHGFYSAEWEAKAAFKKLGELPAKLRIDAAIVKAEIRYDA